MSTSRIPLSPVKAHALLHVTVLVWGFTAILGRGISISAVPLVWYRVGIVALVLAPLMRWRGVTFRVEPSALRAFATVGVMVALHWLSFYACIKHAGIAVAVLCLSSTTFFTAVFEALVFRRALRMSELAVGAGVVVGVALLIRFETTGDAWGLALGLISALFSGWFGALNGLYALTHRAEQLTLYEMFTAWLVTSGFFFFFPEQFVGPFSLSLQDAALLLVLAVGCTVLPWEWSLLVLKTLSPYTMSLAVALEPVYSMIFAYFFFPGEERLTWRFYTGAFLLVVLIAVNAVLKVKRGTTAHAAATPS